MVITDYFKSVERLLNDSTFIVDKSLDFKEFSSNEGMVRGKLLFFGGYILNFMEYIQIGKERPKYSFNFTITFPHHKHTGSIVYPSKEIALAEVISEIELNILAGIKGNPFMD